MAKFHEAGKRLFENIFVCKKCKTKMRTQSNRIKAESVKCRNCGCKALRAKNVKK